MRRLTSLLAPEFWQQHVAAFEALFVQVVQIAREAGVVQLGALAVDGPAEEDRQKGRTPDDGRKSRGRKPFARDFGVPPDDAQDNFTDPESRI